VIPPEAAGRSGSPSNLPINKKMPSKNLKVEREKIRAAEYGFGIPLF